MIKVVNFIIIFLNKKKCKVLGGPEGRACEDGMGEGSGMASPDLQRAWPGQLYAWTCAFSFPTLRSLLSISSLTSHQVRQPQCWRDGQALAQLLPGTLGAPEQGEVEPSPQPVQLSGDLHVQQLKHESSTSAPPRP